MLNIFSRKHGDLERDYNEFVIEATYFRCTHTVQYSTVYSVQCREVSRGCSGSCSSVSYQQLSGGREGAGEVSAGTFYGRSAGVSSCGIVP